MERDSYFMGLAIEQAEFAASLGEVPVGAVICKDGEIISHAYNRREVDKNALAHAELLAIGDACLKLDCWRLSGCELYVTLEPCHMCAGAVINSRVSRVIFGAYDPKAGCFGSVANFAEMGFNHRPELESGVRADECAALLKDFFAKLRK